MTNDKQPEDRTTSEYRQLRHENLIHIILDIFKTK